CTLNWDLGTPGNCEYADEVADVIPNTVWNNGAVSTFPGCPVPCPPLSVSISPNGPTTFCQGGTVILNAVSVAFPATYQWLKDGVVLQGATNSTYTANLPGSYQVRLVLSNALNCSTVSPATLVNVTIPPSAGTLSGQQEICSASSVLFSSTVSGGTWSSSATGVATVNASTGVVTGVAAGTATITYTVSGTGGCANATASRPVTVSSPVSAGVLSGNQSVCVGSTTIFTSTTSGGSWSSSNTNIASVNSLTGEVTGVSAGTAQIVYTVLGTGGCSNTTATRTVNVSSCVPNLITNIGNVTGCVGDTIEVPVTVQMAAGISVAAISLAIDYDISKLQCLNTVSSLNSNIASGFLSNCGI
ncbi:MAG: Ig-like domain-containing protein, partial [Bacteroidota bacterium]